MSVIDGCLKGLVAAVVALGLAACTGDSGAGGAQVGRFVATANFDGSLSVFRTTGAGVLKPVTVFPADLTQVRGVIAGADGQTLYALGDDSSSGVVQALTLDPETGRIVLKNQIRVNRGVAAAALSPDQRHLYVASSSQDGLTQLAIGATGLTMIAPNPAGDPLTSVAIDPTGARVYAVGRDTGTVQEFTRDRASGALTAGPSIQLHEPPTGIAFSRDGTVAYLTLASETNNVQVYDVDAGTGTLTLRKSVSAGHNPMSLTVDAAGAYAYTANASSDNLTVFAIQPRTWDLSEIQTVAGGTAPQQLRIDPTGTLLYSADFSSRSITSFAIDPTTGRLTKAYQVRGRAPMFGLAVARGSAYASKVAQFALAPDSTGVHVYRVADAGGTLEPLETDDAGSGLVDAVVDPVRNVVFAVASDNRIRSYPFGSAPASFTTVAVDSDAVLTRVVLEPSGQYLLALDNRSVSGLSGRIYVFRIGPTGTLEPVQTRAAGRNPENLVFHPAGRYLYSIDSYGDTVTLFEQNLSTGELAQKQTFTPGRTGSGRGRPITMAMHPNGDYAYLTLEDDREIVRYHISESNGFLESPQRLSTSGINDDGRPRYLAVHPDGQHLSVTFWGDLLATYAIGDDFTLRVEQTVPITGQPSFVSIDPQGQFAYVTIKGGTARLPLGPSGVPGTPDPTLTGSDDSSFSRAVTIVSTLH